jgi:glycosyltransferase involved in cell wall biosynthesis
MSPAESLSIVMPAYDEEQNVGEAVRRALEVARSHFRDYEVVVVDDGSRDRTAERVAEAARDEPRVRLISFPQNQGFGVALRTGLKAAQKQLVFYTDADLQFDLSEIALLLQRIEEAPIVIGYRVKRRDPRIRSWNAWAWGRLQYLLFGLDVRDIDCGFKLFRREVVQSLPMRSTGAFLSTEILLRARAAGYRIVEVPVHHYPRRAGSPTGANLRVIARAFRELWELRAELRHLEKGRR